jgi:hypothetical protein
MRRSQVDFGVQRFVERPQDWSEHVKESLASCGVRLRTAAAKNHLANVDWNTYNLEDYLFTHNTIVTSVAHDAKDNHTITAGSACDVNANGNAWLNEVLGPPTEIYRTFAGAENFYEHVQCSTLSKGKVLDAVLRNVRNASGEPVYVVDILVGTHRGHKDLVDRIASGRLKTLSMGCIADVTQCSKCGKLIRREGDNCSCLKEEIRQPYKTAYGYESVVAELCGAPNEKKSTRFIEASWVESPAYQGAVVNHLITAPKLELVLQAHELMQLGDNIIDFSMLTDDSVEMLRRTRVADRSGMLALRLLTEKAESLLKTQRVSRIAGRLGNRIS